MKGRYHLDERDQGICREWEMVLTYEGDWKKSAHLIETKKGCLRQSLQEILFTGSRDSILSSKSRKFWI